MIKTQIKKTNFKYIYYVSLFIVTFFIININIVSAKETYEVTCGEDGLCPDITVDYNTYDQIKITQCTGWPYSSRYIIGDESYASFNKSTSSCDLYVDLTGQSGAFSVSFSWQNFLASKHSHILKIHVINGTSEGPGYGSTPTTVETTCDKMLGNFALDLENILKIIRIVGPLMVLFLSSFEYVSAIFKKDDDALKKANSKLVIRLILIVSLFFLPLLLKLLFLLMGESITTCIS